MALAVVFLAACGGDEGDASPEDQGVGALTTPAALSGDPGECVNLDPCDATVSSASGLTDGDVVRVRINGWGSDEAVGIAQCADAADPDNPRAGEPGPDGLPPGEICNVLDLGGPAQTEQADADGVIDFEYEVVGGARMQESSESGVTCDATHDCVLNVFVSGANRFSPSAPRVTFALRFA